MRFYIDELLIWTVFLGFAGHLMALAVNVAILTGYQHRREQRKQAPNVAVTPWDQLGPSLVIFSAGLVMACLGLLLAIRFGNPVLIAFMAILGVILPGLMNAIIVWQISVEHGIELAIVERQRRRGVP